MIAWTVELISRSTVDNGITCTLKTWTEDDSIELLSDPAFDAVCGSRYFAIIDWMQQYCVQNFGNNWEWRLSSDMFPRYICVTDPECYGDCLVVR